MTRAESTLLWAFDGADLPGSILERASNGVLTGITLFRHHNVRSPAQVRELTDTLRASSPGLPPLIAIDQEAGQFQALTGSTPFAGNLALGAADDLELTAAVGEAIGLELSACGINLNYAPVADIITQANNPSLGIRSFGSDPERVAAHVHAVVTGMRRAGVLTVAKHFPGKGEARVDPHHQLPVLDLSRERLERIEWVPFRAARDAGVDAVMMGHYALPQITGRPDLPSSVAREVVDQVLRIDMGFDGLVITDALDMGALSQGGGSLLEGIAALRAGVDLLLCSADLERAEQLARGVNLAHDRGLIDQFTISESLRRSSAARSRVGPQRPALDVVAGQPHQQLSAELAAKAITLVRDRDDLLPVPTDAKILSVMVHPTDLTPADTSSCEPPRMAEALSARFTHVDGHVVDYVPSAESVHRAVRACADADVAVVGTITANAAQAEMVRAISSQVRTITVALRTPFDLLTYPQVGTHLCSYSLLEPSLLALAGAIHGDPVSGTLPVDIGDLHRRGEGMRQGHQ